MHVISAELIELEAKMQRSTGPGIGSSGLASLGSKLNPYGLKTGGSKLPAPYDNKTNNKSSLFSTGGSKGGGGGAGGKNNETNNTTAASNTSGDGQSQILEEEYDPNYDPTEEEIIEYAQFLGMDLDKDKDLFWIAREGLKAPLPEPWKPCKTEDQEVYYFNFETGDSVWEHPCDEYYKKLFAEEKDKKGNRAKQEEEAKKKKKREKKEKKKAKKEAAEQIKAQPLGQLGRKPLGSLGAGLSKISSFGGGKSSSGDDDSEKPRGMSKSGNTSSKSNLHAAFHDNGKREEEQRKWEETQRENQDRDRARFKENAEKQFSLWKSDQTKDMERRKAAVTQEHKAEVDAAKAAFEKAKAKFDTNEKENNEASAKLRDETVRINIELGKLEATLGAKKESFEMQMKLMAEQKDQKQKECDAKQKDIDAKQQEMQALAASASALSSSSQTAAALAAREASLDTKLKEAEAAATKLAADKAQCAREAAAAAEQARAAQQLLATANNAQASAKVEAERAQAEAERAKEQVATAKAETNKAEAALAALEAGKGAAGVAAADRAAQLREKTQLEQAHKAKIAALKEAQRAEEDSLNASHRELVGQMVRQFDKEKAQLAQQHAKDAKDQTAAAAATAAAAVTPNSTPGQQQQQAHAQITRLQSSVQKLEAAANQSSAEAAQARAQAASAQQRAEKAEAEAVAAAGREQVEKRRGEEAAVRLNALDSERALWREEEARLSNEVRRLRAEAVQAGQSGSAHVGRQAAALQRLEREAEEARSAAGRERQARQAAEETLEQERRSLASAEGDRAAARAAESKTMREEKNRLQLELDDKGLEMQRAAAQHKALVTELARKLDEAKETAELKMELAEHRTRVAQLEGELEAAKLQKLGSRASQVGGGSAEWAAELAAFEDREKKLVLEAETDRRTRIRERGEERLRERARQEERRQERDAAAARARAEEEERERAMVQANELKRCKEREVQLQLDLQQAKEELIASQRAVSREREREVSRAREAAQESETLRARVQELDRQAGALKALGRQGAQGSSQLMQQLEEEVATAQAAERVSREARLALVAEHRKQLAALQAQHTTQILELRQEMQHALAQQASTAATAPARRNAWQENDPLAANAPDANVNANAAAAATTAAAGAGTGAAARTSFGWDSPRSPVRVGVGSKGREDRRQRWAGRKHCSPSREDYLDMDSPRGGGGRFDGEFDAEEDDLTEVHFLSYRKERQRQREKLGDGVAGWRERVAAEREVCSAVRRHLHEQRAAVRTMQGALQSQQKQWKRAKQHAQGAGGGAGAGKHGGLLKGGIKGVAELRKSKSKLDQAANALNDDVRTLRGMQGWIEKKEKKLNSFQKLLNDTPGGLDFMRSAALEQRWQSYLMSDVNQAKDGCGSSSQRLHKPHADVTARLATLRAMVRRWARERREMRQTLRGHMHALKEFGDRLSRASVETHTYEAGEDLSERISTAIGDQLKHGAGQGTKDIVIRIKVER